MKYIIYRYNRALVRRSNTTDESILSLIKNNSFDSASFSNEISDKRDLITNEVSIDLAKRVLLPENVTKAHDSGIIYFHDMNSFIQPIVNASLINISDMLDNSTVINGKLIESPKTFLVACIVTTQIISTLISSQAGGISIDVSTLSKYLKKSYDKFYKSLKEKYKNKISDSLIESITLDKVNEELKSGIQIINYQVNTIMTNIKDKSLSITVFLNLNGDSDCVHETSLIIEEILRQKQGLTETSELKFSKHAAMRLESRNINLTDEQNVRLESGVQKASEKGINESLVLVDSLAFIVNVPNKTVVTAIDQQEATENIFTNIDGAVII